MLFCQIISRELWRTPAVIHLGAGVLCRSGVRAKFGVDTGNTEESELSRLVKEKRIGQGWKQQQAKKNRNGIVADLMLFYCFCFIMIVPIFFKTLSFILTLSGPTTGIKWASPVSPRLRCPPATPR